ncbi:MAG: MFS transporter [Acidobacteriaceae bacterium]
MAAAPIPVPVARKHPLRNPLFRLLWMGSTVSAAGDQFYFVAMPWLVLGLTGSSIALGTIGMVGAIPRAGLMLLGGAVTDRVSPRRIMMLTASARTVLVALVAALLWAHGLHLWQLYVLALCFGIADAFAAPAAQTFMPSLVEAGQLPAAQSVFQSTSQITTLVAPGPAGLFIKAFGMAWALFIDAVSFLFILGALWRLPDPPRPAAAAARRNMLQSIGDGLGYVKADVALRSMMLVVAVLNFAIAGPVSLGLVWIAKKSFGTPSALGLLMSCLAAGSLVGMLLAGLVKHRRRGRTLLLVATVIGVCLMPMGLLHRLWSLGAVLCLMSVAAAFLNVQLIAWFQQQVERPMMGRVMSVLMFSSLGLMPISLAIAGVAIRVSLEGMFLVAGATVLVVTLLAAMHRVVREID